MAQFYGGRSPSLIKGFTKTPEVEQYFAGCYQSAFEFVFNESFPLHPKNLKEMFDENRSSFLGTAMFEPSTELGLLQYDAAYFLFDSEDGIETHLLQIHIRPKNSREFTDQIFIGKLCAHLNHFLYSDDSRWGRSETADPALKLWLQALSGRRTGFVRTKDEQRHYSQPHSVFITFSAYGMERSAFNNRAKFKRPIYRLLNLQSKGTDEKKELETMEEGWTSTNFFDAWFQPGCSVVVSTGYPEETYTNNPIFAASFFDNLYSSEAGDTESYAARIRNKEFTNTVPEIMTGVTRASYDSLPEYPPLRYVTPVVALYGLLYEEVLRDTYDRLLSLSMHWPLYHPMRYLNFISSGVEIKKLTRRLSRIDTLEHLRLPISRPLGGKFLESKLHHQVAKAIDQLRANQLTLAARTMSILAILFTISIAILRFTGH